MTIRTRTIAWATAAQTLLAGVACFVPLLNLLGYEFALATGLLAAVTAPCIGFAWGRGCTAGASVQPRALVGAMTAAAAHLLPGLALIAMNALRVRNCNFAQGLGFAATLTIATALYGSCLGFAVQRMARAGSRGLQVGLTIATVVTPLALTLHTLFVEPPIVVFDHLWGFFAGSLYDETIELDARLLAFRGGTLLRIVLIAAVLVAWERTQRHAQTSRWRRAAALRALALTALAACLAFAYDVSIGRAIGFRVRRADIEAALPAVITRPGLVIHLPAEIRPQQQDAIADDHAFRLAQVRERLGIENKNENGNENENENANENANETTIHSYVYRNAEHKARLMGGHGTMVSKPWLREIHIHGLETPHPVLAHELVHAALAQFGASPLAVPARFGVLVNLVLVEGIAVAASYHEDELDLHHATRALEQLGAPPQVAAILGPARFWAQAAPRAYATAGSFIGYLLDTRGSGPLLRAYRDGDLAAAYGQPLAALVAQWQQFLQGLELAPAEIEIAHERFRHPSLFVRTCAHEVARLRERAQGASPDEAVRLQRQICEHLSQDDSARLDLALALQRAGGADEFLSLAKELLASDHSALSAAQKTRLLSARGDVLWRRGDLTGAGEAADAALSLDASAANQRLQWVRRWALTQDAAIRDTMLSLLTGKNAPAAAAKLLTPHAERLQQDKTLAYLVGRQRVTAGAYAHAVEPLQRAAGHDFAPIEAERLRLLGETQWRLGDLPAAAAAFRGLHAMAPTSGGRAAAEDWLARVAWSQRKLAVSQETRYP